ncbi:MAG TPA: 1-(5-phosphoribosyl)-5-[(5-phosphoribosylamino)methylideneamino]imidazole-4-carboxamide isomerase [Anaerolineae bacterium]|nr:1-(5-phosphoribosyl)-5-[(5-phosphoribosylamino)methylideneamino]imidazole-4-carboxamide isomerase [Anaerolineae bacterium]HOQ97220.1 1-(5-phosphoribosyl)-5-[(5-phosphoribosylamino)methylideneamino]imidazole-4-carboxamide isomerase [Anaerolineae bacterium]HPL26445.1 1-(5-phosphoribosyl)-5-[(5-phosphoribosylamino)methylideneamino]imidazole-4-carboxamide isomerase [Anaerolineae bacterium]
MIVIPAIDLRGGRCVRLRQGDPQAETTFSDDPAAIARRWAGCGATWLHVVNLDGALEDERASAVDLQALQAILRAVTIPVQFGGGLRTLDDVARVLDLGVRRAILGTAAVRDHGLVAQALARFGRARILAAIDARDGRVAIRGWQEATPLQATALGRELKDLGIERAVYTDIARDGMLGGPNLEATRALAAETGLHVIASGGIAHVRDLQALAALGGGVEGAIVGRALYTGAIDLRTALHVAQGRGEG